MKTKLISSSILLVLLSMGAVQATPVAKVSFAETLSNPVSPFTVSTGTGTFNTFGTGTVSTLKYVYEVKSGTPGAYTTNLFPNDNTVTAGKAVETLFGLSIAPALVGQIDSAPDGTVFDKDTAKSSFSGNFRYLTAHYGGQNNQEFVFDFGPNGVSKLSLSYSENGLSNYRAYGAVTSVPEPDEYAMMIIGAGMLSYQINRKRKDIKRG